MGVGEESVGSNAVMVVIAGSSSMCGNIDSLILVSHRLGRVASGL